MKLFSGTSNPELASKVARRLSSSLSALEIIRFKNSEVRVSVKEPIDGKECAIIQTTSRPSDEHLIELAFTCDALKGGKAKKIITVIPYFGYSRQSSAQLAGECVSARVVSRLLESAGANKIITIDIHDKLTKTYFSIPFLNLSAMPLLARHMKDDIKPETAVILSPDKGGIERARVFGRAYFGHDNFKISVIEKHRSRLTPHKSRITGFEGNVTNKDVIIVDDIITSGGTLLPAVELALEHGARSVYAAATHADFLPGVAKYIQSSKLKRLYITDTIAFDQKPFPKIKKLSAASLISKALKNNS